MTLGSGDSDAFQYDSNTGRMTQYDFNVNGKTVTGNLGWNANGTLGSLSVSDAFSSADTQTCKFGDPNALPPVPGYDDLGRLISANCGSIWSQTFSLDPFGNLSKSGTISFQPTYNTWTNQVTKVGGVAPSYDADGNTTSDTVNTYSWDSDGNMIKAVTPSATTQVTYDALDRAVEFLVGSSYTEVVYGPGGRKFALLSGQTLTKVFVPLAGGAVAVYNSSGLAYYRHPDWLGSSRLASTTSRGVYYDGAYAPYGENYAETGTTDRSFTGENQDMVSSGSYPLYDFLMREYNATWGRWISPDPAGLAAANPTSPQSWNRYAYVVNNPLSFVDPLGLDSQTCSPGQQPPRPDLVCGPSHHWQQRVCNDMNCADQYYGGELFYGDITVMQGICLIGGVLGYCGEGALASFMSPTGSDEFDVMDPASGVYWSAPPGSLQCNSSGRCSTSTGSLGFSDLLWSQMNNTSDVLEGPVATRGTPLAPSQTEQLLAQLNAGNYFFGLNPGSAAGQSPGTTEFSTWVPYVWTPALTPLGAGTWVAQPPQWAALPGWWFSGQ